MPYPLGVVAHRGQLCVVGSTEDHGPLFLAAPPYREAVEILPGPGGSMSLVADTERPGDLYAIMGCFLGYKFQTGAIYRIHPEGDGWASSKILGLPFAHRIDFVNRGRDRFLVAASLAADKRDPADWSQPGTVYACPVPKRAAEPWQLVPVLEGIHRNHGLLVTRFMGRRLIAHFRDRRAFRGGPRPDGKPVGFRAGHEGRDQRDRGERHRQRRRRRADHHRAFPRQPPPRLQGAVEPLEKGLGDRGGVRPLPGGGKSGWRAGHPHEQQGRRQGSAAFRFRQDRRRSPEGLCGTDAHRRRPGSGRGKHAPPGP